MHVLAITDVERLHDEERMISRTCAGLRERGCRVTLVIPRRLPESLAHVSSGGLGADTICTAAIPPSFWRRKRGDILPQLDLEDAPPDITWAMGEATHELAVRVAEHSRSPAVLDIRSNWTARRTSSRENAVGGWITASPTLASIVAKRVGPELVECLLPGVDPGTPRARNEQQATSMAILDAGEDTASMHALLSCLPWILKEIPGLQVCIENPDNGRDETWRLVRSLELLRHVSMVPGAAGVHELLAQCDVVIQPDRRSPARTILLEAMKHRSTVISARNPCLDWLVDGETGVLVAKARKEAWNDAILNVLLDSHLRERVGQAAREHVLEYHGMEEYLDSLLGTFRRASKGFSYPFALQGAT